MVRKDVVGRLYDEAIEETEGFIGEARRRPKKPWNLWIEAELGLRNYWYPGALSRHLGEGQHKAVQLLGEDILLARQDGHVYAIENRCPHRGVRFSERPLFYTKETITCWYHTWTFGIDDGVLRVVLNQPGTSLVGKCKIRSYPIEERKGIVFVFIGDIDPTPLEADVPPGFLDRDAAIYCAEPYEIASNWRLGCENGFDPGHHFVHNWSPMAIAAGMPIGFGFVATKENLINTVTYSTNDPGPCGFTRRIEVTAPRFDCKIPLKDGSEHHWALPLARDKTPEEIDRLLAGLYQTTVGLWMPCGLKVDPFPRPPCVHYEFYVPKDERTHIYFQFGVIHTTDEHKAREWTTGQGYFLHDVPVVQGFTIDDVYARKQMQKFYEEEDGWYTERLYRPDIEITM